MTETLEQPRPETGADTVRILVCASCRAAGGDPDAPRPGTLLAAALDAALADGESPGLSVETVECLSVCKRPCTVALTGAGRWTYVYGDLDPQSGAQTLITFARQYRDTPDGIVPWRERAEAIRKGVVARIPPTSIARYPMTSLDQGALHHHHRLSRRRERRRWCAICSRTPRASGSPCSSTNSAISASTARS